MATLLTTLASVKAFMGLTDTNANRDALLTELIAQVSQGIETICQRTIGQGSYTEDLDGRGNSSVWLHEWPVTAVASVIADGTSIALAADSQAVGFRFTDAGEVYLSQGARFARGRGNVRVAYTAGYADIPADLKLAANRAVAGVFKTKEAVGFQSKVLATESVTYMDELSRPGVKDVLNNYKRTAP